jgi:hypothetical protein
MFVTVNTPFSTHRFDCDEAVIRKCFPSVDDPKEKDENTIFLTVYKNKTVIKEMELQKDHEHAIYFMNDQGQTVDSLYWADGATVLE